MDNTRVERGDFNADWAFAMSEAEWPDDFAAEDPTTEPVSLPHTWNAQDMQPGSSDPHIGGGWYRKSFSLSSFGADRRVLVEFEGVTNRFSAWLNDGYAGGRNGGFLPTLLDVTDLMEEGENALLVRADNSYDVKAAMPRWIDWNRYGGITRPVWLRLREHAYLTVDGVRVRTPRVSPKSAATVVTTRIEETLEGGAELEIRHILTGPGGEPVSEATVPLSSSFSVTNSVEVELPPIANPALWSDIHPSLYSLETLLIEGGVVIDRRTDSIGYRFYRFDPDEGFFLNGRPVKLRGANIHIFYPGLGNALPERFHRSEMELMRRMGCNYMRASHYPRPKACLDACDELGILVLEEQPYWHGSVRAAGGEEAIDNVPRLIGDLVQRHGNHPSIIAWNTVNEVMLAPAYKPGVGHLEPGDPRREAWQINPKEYPYIRRHLQTMVDTFRQADPERPVSMVVGGAWEQNDVAGLTAMTDIVAYNGGALNFGDDAFIGPRNGKRYTFRPDYFREMYPRRVHMMSEGILNDIVYSRGEWEREDAAWRRSAEYWSTIYQRPWFCGGSMWCFTDYSANGDTRLHGVVDRYRLPKELFFFFEAMWSVRPVIHILGHWDHCPGAAQDVVVFTNCTDVELRLNGKSVPRGAACSDRYPGIPNAPLVWPAVRFEPGLLEATGKHGDLELSDTRFSSGTPAEIALAGSNDLNADGRDIAYVDLTVCDSDGHRCYTFEGPVRIEDNGAARLAAPSEIQISAGRARATVRSTGSAGAVSARADAHGLEAGELTLQAREG